MRGGLLPPALLFAALAFALAFAPRAGRAAAIVAALAVAIAVSQLPLPAASIEPIFLACWVSVVVTAATIHRPAGRWLAIGLGVNAGVWAGATVAVAGTALDLATATTLLLLVVPAAGLVGSARGIAVKVAGSWLIAVALLAAVLPFVVTTPGYAPDHME